MATDIFSMTQIEFAEKVKQQHLRVKKENAKQGLPTTGYSQTYNCVVDTYEDGSVVKVDVNKTKVEVPKSQNYGS